MYYLPRYKPGVDLTHARLWGDYNEEAGRATCLFIHGIISEISGFTTFDQSAARFLLEQQRSGYLNLSLNPKVFSLHTEVLINLGVTASGNNGAGAVQLFPCIASPFSILVNYFLQNP